MVRFLAACLLMCFTFSVGYGAQRSRIADVETLLLQLEARAQAIEVVQWDFTSIALKGTSIFGLPASDDLFKAAHDRGVGSFKEVEKNKSEGTVIYNVKTGAYRINISSIQPWVGGPTAYLKGSRSLAFDGSIYSQYTTPPDGVSDKAELGREGKKSERKSKKGPEEPPFFVQV